MKEQIALEILNRLKEKNENISSYINKNDINAILHELDVFEAELIAQNEELLEQEKVLHDAKEEYELLFNNSPICYIVLDKDFKVQKYNILADHYFNFSASKKNNISFLPYVSSEDLKKLFDFIDVENSEKRFRNIYCNIRTNGKLNKNLFKVSKELIDFKKNEHIILSLDDIQKEYEVITKVRELEKQKLRQQEFLLKDKDAILIQQSKMAAMGEMIGNIAHQWRQPLNNLSLSIANIIYKYNKNSLDDNSINKFEEKTKKAISLMDETIDDFRNFFSTDKSASVVDICESINIAIKMLDDSFKYHNINVNLYSSFCPYFYGNKNELAQVILNVLANSKDALILNNTSNAHIDINIYDKGSSFDIVIEDNAGGVEDNILDELCKPYFTTKRENGGTGIGLYISKMIIETFKGEFKISNTPIGLKTTISLEKKELNA